MTATIFTLSNSSFRVESYFHVRFQYIVLKHICYEISEIQNEKIKYQKYEENLPSAITSRFALLAARKLKFVFWCE